MNPSGRPRVGVMGGTFDPIHVGHLVAASEVADQLRLDQVIFIPAGEPWQKADRPVSDAEHRYAMTVLATGADPRFFVSRLEIDRSAPTYSVDTFRDLHEIHRSSDPEWFLIAGADVLAGIGTWREPEALVELVQLVAVNRPGHVLPGGGPLSPDRIAVEMPGLGISSSDCRERVRSGRSIAYLVPQEVATYIDKHGLYRGGAS
ncbi:MAG: nicotinate-nucleotide adenylyltransferase [Candidatus Nanopelagicales bacterium]|nr:nicotinate-nucleotide adenylyltransferase [Candidatus Nanopelagicales bacterium]